VRDDGDRVLIFLQKCGGCWMVDVVAYLGWMLALPETLYVLGLLASFEVFFPAFIFFFIVDI